MPSSSNKTQIRWDLYSKSSKSDKAIEKAIISQIEGMISIEAKALEESANFMDDGNRGIAFVILSLHKLLNLERTFANPSRYSIGSPCAFESSSQD